MYVQNFTSDDFYKLKDNVNTVIIPVGSLEAHGHHLPLGTDIFSPRALCQKIDEKYGGNIWIAPEIPYGVSYDLSVYPGTVTMPSDVLAAYLFHVGESFLKNGMENIVVLNGHGGNVTAINFASEKLTNAGAVVLVLSWWLDYAKKILKITKGQGHAGEDETACMLAYDAQLVQMDKATKNMVKMACPVRYKERGLHLMKDAMTGDATLATKAQGEKIFDVVSDGIIEHIKLMQEKQYYREP